MACWELDKSLEKEGLQFARYADDTIIWSNDYAKINKSIEIMTSFSRDIGVSINQEKSEGISMLCPKEMRSEFSKYKEEVEFLGYALSINKISIKKSSVVKIKRQISYILYKHLIQPLKPIKLTALKIPANNKDEALLSAICEIRRYLYGNLSENMLTAFLNGRNKRIFFKGLMSFYPLINDVEQLKSLDGWLSNAVFKAVRKRSKLLIRHNQPRTHMFPFNVSRKKLIHLCEKQKINNQNLLKIPSFLRIYQVMQKGLIEQGIDGVTSSYKNIYY